MHVLIVGDGALVHLLLKFALEDAGFGVLEATSSREALELAKSRVDFIFLDVTAFDPEGVELLEELKQESPGSMVIIVTQEDGPDATPALLMEDSSGRYTARNLDLVRMMRSVLEKVRRTSGERLAAPLLAQELN